jgi:hypothetical protein
MTQEKDLNPAEFDALQEIARLSLLRKAIPAEMQHRLIAMGYIEEKLGDLVATTKGRAYLVPRPKRRRRTTWHPS